MTAGQKKELLVRVALAVVGPLVLIGGLEVGARLLGLSSGFFLRPGAGSCTRRSALLELEPRPNCAGDLHGTQVRYNSLGLRGAEVRDDGSRRILAIGDSCTWGWRVADDESYPAALQRLLDGRHGRGAFQVINAGVPGYTSYRGLLYLRERGLALAPAIVIAGYGFNDASPDGDDELRIAENRRLLPLFLVEDFLIEHSRFYRWARWRMERTQQRVREKINRVTPEKYARNLSEIVRLSRANGAEVLLVNFAVFRNAPRYRKALAGVAERLDVSLLVYEGPKLDLVHPTAEGYERFAGRILERVQEAGWLEEAPLPSRRPHSS